MSWQENRDNADDALRAGIATGFVLLGASIVLGVVVEPAAARLFLGLSSPLTALLAGVYAYRSARDGGAR